MDSLIKQIDHVLNAIHDTRAPTKHEIQIQLEKQAIVVKDEVLEAILLKLVEDNYINKENSQQYILTYGGLLFKYNGGYQAKSLADAAAAEQQQLEINRLKSVDVSSDQNQKKLNKLTNRLSWATWFAFGAALGLLIWSIYSYYHPAPIPVNVKVKVEK